jgi:hypothetical protein
LVEQAAGVAAARVDLQMAREPTRRMAAVVVVAVIVAAVVPTRPMAAVAAVHSLPMERISMVSFNCQITTQETAKSPSKDLFRIPTRMLSLILWTIVPLQLISIRRIVITTVQVTCVMSARMTL